MAEKRRSLVAGLEVVPTGVDPDAMRSFITQEKPKPTMEVVPTPPASEVGEGAFTAQTTAEFVPPKQVAKPAPARRVKPSPLHANLLVPITIRLKPDIADGLKRASLQRQLNGVQTYTQQDIVEEALLPWLQAEGLLD